MDFHQKMRQERRAIEMTQSELGQHVGLSQATISRIEKGYDQHCLTEERRKKILQLFEDRSQK